MSYDQSFLIRWALVIGRSKNMASKRMFAHSVMDTDAFSGMSHEAQLLYVRLNLEADDDGFVSSPRRVMKIYDLAEEAYDELLRLRYVLVFESGICVIKHWGMMNSFIRSDSYKETSYIEEKALLDKKKDGAYTLKSRDRDENVAQYSIDKVSIDKNNTKEDKPPDPPEGAKTFYTGDGLRLASLLSELIQANSPSWKGKPKDVEKWAADIDKIVRIDGRTWEQVEYMIRWVQADGFWQRNILSGKKLREKFNDLIPKLKPQQSKGRGFA